jgi:hypothetical protein
VGQPGLTRFYKRSQDNITQFLTDWSQISSPFRKRIEEFSLLWQIFEGRCANAKFVANTVESSVLAGNFDQCIDQNWQADGLAEALNYFYLRYGNQDRLSALMNGRNELLDRITFGLSIQTQQCRDPAPNRQQQLCSLIFVVYRLRNNLFHGVKGREGLDGQEQNFHHAIKVLNSLLRCVQTP